MPSKGAQSPMCQDIEPLLTGWDYVPGELTVRTVEGKDRHPKIQIRTDLGLMQLEWEGRPDGTRPHDAVSLLDHYRSAVDQSKAAGFKLTREDCWLLGQEAIQYYWRRMSFFELKEYDRAEADAVHNLDILDLCERYGEHEEDRQIAEQYRVFVTTHRIQARALARLEEDDFDGALAEIGRGATHIEDILEKQGDFDHIDECMELRFLRDWQREVEQSRPRTLRERLSDELATAVEDEQFERAARLRDRLRTLGSKGGEEAV